MKLEPLDTNIEQQLGNFKKLPNYPFNTNGKFAIFPGAEEACIDEHLYRALFKGNSEIGN